jgi:PII-like signaling protein
MSEREKAKLPRIFLEETDKLGGKPLYEAIVPAAQEAGLAGATVLRGIESYGHTGRVHTAKVLRLAEHMPLVVEIVDSEPKIEAFLPTLDGLFGGARGGGLVTLEAVEIISYPPGKKG